MRQLALGRPCLVASLLVALSITPAAGQDSNYWTHQYGTAANLLGGNVVGSVTDISATYYNPGALPLIQDAALFTASKVFELTSLNLSPDLGIPANLSSLQVGLAPGFVGGRAPFKFLGGNVLSYSVFTRQYFNTTMDATSVGSFADIGLSPPDATYLGRVRLYENMSDTWVGVSYSAMLGSKIGVGLTLYGAYRNQSLEGAGQLEAYADTAQEVGIRQTNLSYWNYRMLLKAGITFESHGVSLGATVTTASLSIFGDGSTLVNRTQFGTEDPVFTAAYFEGLSSTFKSPFSVAVGAGYSPVAGTTLHATAELFSKVPQYSVLQLSPFVSQSSGDTISFDVTDLRDQVFNVGLGVDHRFSPTLTGYASFRTDYSGAPTGPTRSDIVFTDWNLYFVTTGAQLKIGTAGLTLGVSYGWGKQNDMLLTYDLDGEESQVGEPHTADVTYRTLRFILALAL